MTAGVFPCGAERAVYNNALFERDLGPAERRSSIEAMETTYGSAAVDRYAAWVHESDRDMRGALSARGYAVEESTRAMGRSLDGLSLADPGAGVEPLGWNQYLEFLHGDGVPPDLLNNADPGAFHVLGVRRGGEIIAAALAFDCDGDAGIYNMGTLERARGRGLATALTVRQLQDARERGCSTASLQATPVAERVYAAAGFQDLGRFLEFYPPSS